jgi:Na+/pantothenate symporter
MIAGAILMCIMIVNNPNVGGFSNAVEHLRAVKPSLVSVFGGSNWKFLCTNILLTSFGAWGLPQMIHKFYAIKDEKSIKIGAVITTIFALIIGGGAYFTGVFGRFFVAAGPTGAPAVGFDSVVPNMLKSALGSGIFENILLSVIMLLLLSASMSTLSSVVLTSSSAISVDLMKVIRPDKVANKSTRFTRILCFIFVGLSFLFATFNFAIIVSIMSFSWGIVSGCFVGPYIWGLYSKKTTRAGAWAGMISGIVTVAVMTLYNMAISPALKDGAYAAFKAASANSPIYGVTAMAISFVIVPLVSNFTKKLPETVVERAFARESLKAEV